MTVHDLLLYNLSVFRSEELRLFKKRIYSFGSSTESVDLISSYCKYTWTPSQQ